ncbi:uncharacterized protein LOC103312273 [Tribolium castaneum]|uniref:DUF4773 domain-containing protein n=1 Tax=Tribolium castaneum TaxID=7070 RepID=D6W6H0_TRICA|nr:PREDICTED: uncharacterized protein LOC103312273 [Tribolium castaneum]EFA11060.1 hypothetical protein TcasGA2_TC004655 [Tribolium castaneum]|eukprot:XP_008190723.1 PREDICTED: uncharacterized protein LOC103312273 [Tribolium castaneum]
MLVLVGLCLLLISHGSATIAESCQCSGLTCICCGSIPAIQNNACLEAVYDPHNLELDLNFLANGESVYKTKINSGNFPICAPVFPPACWAFNRIHIDKDNAQVCSEVRIGPVPILKVPCLAYAGGNLIASPNIY